MLWEEGQKINKKKEAEGKLFLRIHNSDCVDFSEEYFEVSKTQFDRLIIK